MFSRTRSQPMFPIHRMYYHSLLGFASPSAVDSEGKLDKGHWLGILAWLEDIPRPFLTQEALLESINDKSNINQRDLIMLGIRTAVNQKVALIESGNQEPTDSLFSILKSYCGKPTFICEPTKTETTILGEEVQFKNELCMRKLIIDRGVLVIHDGGSSVKIMKNGKQSQEISCKNVNANGNIHEYLNVLKIVKTIREYAKKWAKQNKFCDFWYGNIRLTKLEICSQKLAIPYNNPNGNPKALLVGVFDTDSELSSFAPSIIKSLQMVYLALERAGIPKAKIFTLYSNENRNLDAWPTTPNIYRELKRLLTDDKSGRKFFYFTGHGKRIRTNSWCPDSSCTNAQFCCHTSTGFLIASNKNSISDKQLINILMKSKFTGHLTVVFESCNSGNMLKLKPTVIQRFKVISFSSCGENQVSISSHGKGTLAFAFTWEFFNALYENPKLTIRDLIQQIDLAKKNRRYPYNQDVFINANYHYGLDEKIWE
ncbi:unnamed protein product [Rotaria socialis]|uniref:Peptidase C14 caspase domain-containing protein n=1 Tax=Rotaria socialis TaxID=392032 RepID=A0A821V3G5_9BILA|nr:unnamed protein product [Rotaria socialis]CAF4901466.1 unnamed protein product [Rotaria socialis]